MKKIKDNKGRVLQEGESYRNDGRYQYRYTTIDGKRKTVYARNLDELREKEREIKADLYNGYNVSDRNMTVDKMYEICKASRQFLKATTKRNYEDCYRRYAKNILGSKRLIDVKYTDIVIFYKYLAEEKGISVESIKCVNSALVPIFKTALRDGIIRCNPMEGVLDELRKSNGYQPVKRKAVSEEQLALLLDFMQKENSKILNVFIVLMLTGMRVSELCGLMWEDVDFENDVINVKHNLAYTRENGKYQKVMQTPKTNSGRRSIPMLSKVKEVLLEERRKCRIITLGEYKGFVFGNRRNTPYTSTDIEVAFTNVVKRYNKAETAQAEKENRQPILAKHFSPHQLRHSFCNMLCANDLNIKIIQDIMGHASVQTTMDIYCEVSESKKRAELSRIEEKLQKFKGIG